MALFIHDMGLIAFRGIPLGMPVVVLKRTGFCFVAAPHSRPFSTYPSSQLNVLRHYCAPLRVDSTQVGVLA